MEINAITINFPWEFQDLPGLTASRLDQWILPISRLSKSRFTGSRLDSFFELLYRDQERLYRRRHKLSKSRCKLQNMHHTTAAHLRTGKQYLILVNHVDAAEPEHESAAMGP